MVTSAKKKVINDKMKWIAGGAIGFLVLLIGFVLVFGTPSAESVFKDMGEQMLKTKSFVVDQDITMNGDDGSKIGISAKFYMDMDSQQSTLLASGDFSMDIEGTSVPMSVAGDLIKIGDNSYVKYSEMSSSNSNYGSIFRTIESKLQHNWVKVRTDDQYSTISKTPIDFMSSIFPTPYANLNDEQRKDVLELLREESMYDIEESAKVDVDGVSAYKYTIKYNKDQYEKVADAIAKNVKYFKNESKDRDSEIESYVVWVNISTKQIMKIEFDGTTNNAGKAKCTMRFSDYDKTQKVEKPEDYYMESELI